MRKSRFTETQIIGMIKEQWVIPPKVRGCGSRIFSAR